MYVTSPRCVRGSAARGVELDLAAILIKSEVIGAPHACTLPGSLPSFSRISMHTADFYRIKMLLAFCP